MAEAQKHLDEMSTVIAMQQEQLDKAEAEFAQEGILKMTANFLAHGEGVVLEVDDKDVNGKFRNKIKIKDWMFVDGRDVPVWYSNVNRSDSSRKPWDRARKEKRFVSLVVAERILLSIGCSFIYRPYI